MSPAPANSPCPQEGLDLTVLFREALAVSLVVTDDRKRIIAFNSNAEETIGQPASQILSQSIDLLPNPIPALIRETLSNRKPISDRHFCFQAGHQPGIEFSASTVLLHLQTQKNPGVALIFKPLTPGKMFLDSLHQLNRLASIGTLSAGIAHEVKNALVPIRSFVELLTQQNPQAELADVVHREIRRINSLVSQMLKFAGPGKPVLTALHLHEALDHSLRLLEFQMAGKQISLERAFTAKPDLVRGDAYQLEQVFTNVLMNALEAMKAGGKVEVVTDRITATAPTQENVAPSKSVPADSHPTLVRVQIRDTGIGIPPENLSRLFDTFFTTKPNGTGLGLTISRRIVLEHGGDITAQSEPNKGTTFTITFPAVNDE